jgi:hypothetical protein
MVVHCNSPADLRSNPVSDAEPQSTPGEIGDPSPLQSLLHSAVPLRPVPLPGNRPAPITKAFSSGSAHNRRPLARALKRYPVGRRVMDASGQTGLLIGQGGLLRTLAFKGGGIFEASSYARCLAGRTLAAWRQPYGKDEPCMEPTAAAWLVKGTATPPRPCPIAVRSRGQPAVTINPP